MNQWLIVPALLAALLHAIANGIYTFFAVTGKNKPNAASWGIWAFLSLLSGLSYAQITDWVAGAQFISQTVTLLVSFFIMLFAGRLSRLKKEEWWYLITGVVAAIIWYVYQSAAAANFIVLVVTAVSFWPTVKALYHEPWRERPLPWWLLVTAFAITLGVVIAKNGILSIGVISPLTMLTLNIAVATLASRRNIQNGHHKE